MNMLEYSLVKFILNNFNLGIASYYFIPLLCVNQSGKQNNNDMKMSVNCCRRCRRNLTLTADNLGYKICADCLYFENRGIYTIEQYNEYLKGLDQCKCK